MGYVQPARATDRRGRDAFCRHAFRYASASSHWIGSSDYVWAYRYPVEDLEPGPPPEPSAVEARAWIAEIETL